MTTARAKAKAEDALKAKANRKFEWTWKEINGLVYGDCGADPSEKVYAFDMVSKKSSLTWYKIGYERDTIYLRLACYW